MSRPEAIADSSRPDLSFRPALLLMGGRLAGFTASFFIPVVLVRLFDPAQFGTYKQLFLLHATLISAAQVGIAECLYFFLPRAGRESGSYVANSVLVLTASGLAVLAFLVVLAPVLGSALSNPDLSGHLGVIGVYLLLTLASAVLEITMVSRHRYLSAGVSYALSDVVRALCLVVPALAFGSLQGLLAGAAVFGSLRCAATLLYLRREFGATLTPDRRILGIQLGYALPFAGAVLLETIQANYHHYAVSHAFDAASYALYSVGCLQIPLVDFVAPAVANVMMVRMRERIGRGPEGAIPRIWRDATCKLALFFFPLAILLVVLGRDLIPYLFTRDYVRSVPIFSIWSLTLFLSVLQVDGVLRTYGRTKFLLALGAARLALVAGLMGGCLRRFGMEGAVGITVAALALSKGVALLRIGSLMEADVSDLLPWREHARILAAACTAVIPVVALESVVASPPLLRLAAAGAVYAVSYALLLAAMGLLPGPARFRWSLPRAGRAEPEVLSDGSP